MFLIGRRLPAAVIGLGLVIASAGAASGATVTFNSRAAFDAAFPGATLENWDAYADGLIIPDGSTLNGITYNASGPGEAVVTNAFLPSTLPNGLGSTPGEFFDGPQTMTFTFGVPVFAFGIDINTFATANGAYLAVTNLGEIVASVFDPFPGSNTGQFIGFSTNLAFTSITISSPANNTYTLDTLRYAVQGNVVPEPASLLLLGLGVAAFSRTRGKRASS